MIIFIITVISFIVTIIVIKIIIYFDQTHQNNSVNSPNSGRVGGWEPLPLPRCPRVSIIIIIACNSAYSQFTHFYAKNTGPCGQTLGWADDEETHSVGM